MLLAIEGDENYLLFRRFAKAVEQDNALTHELHSQSEKNDNRKNDEANGLPGKKPILKVGDGPVNRDTNKRQQEYEKPSSETRAQLFFHFFLLTKPNTPSSYRLLLSPPSGLLESLR